MSPTPYLELEGVAAHLGERRVFHNLSLQLNLGEHTVVLGPNGAGKSALVKLISREIYPVVQQGSHLRLFGDRTVNLWQLRRRIGLVSSDLERLYNPAVRATMWCSPVALAQWASAAAKTQHLRCSNGWLS